MNINLKRCRIKNGYTQKEIASYLNMPYRTYQNYEEGLTTCPKWLEDLIIYRVNSEIRYSFDKGIYNLKQIKFISIPIFMKYKVKISYLFGEYTSNATKPTSELNFLIISNLPLYLRLRLKTELENQFNKKVNIYSLEDYDEKGEFIKSIYKTGKTVFSID